MTSSINKSNSNRSRSQRSITDKNNKKKVRNNDIREFSIQQDRFSLFYRQGSPKKYHRDKRQNKENKDNCCKKCQITNTKLKQMQQHFKKVIIIHNQQMCSLKLINEDLRFQLQTLHQNLEKQHIQMEKLRQTLMTFNKFQQGVGMPQQKNKGLSLNMSAINHEKQPLKIKQINSKCLTELQQPTFSQLLDGTPNLSQIKPNNSIIDKITKQQKQNALKSQFQRLLNECAATNNKYKKSTIRKQLATIANQLSTLTKQDIFIN